MRELLHERQDNPAKAANPVFLVIDDLARLRDLRKADDDLRLRRLRFERPGNAFADENPRRTAARWAGRGHPHDPLDRRVDHAGAFNEPSGELNEFGTIVIFQTTAAEGPHFLDHVAASRLNHLGHAGTSIRKRNNQDHPYCPGRTGALALPGQTRSGTGPPTEIDIPVLRFTAQP